MTTDWVELEFCVHTWARRLVGGDANGLGLTERSVGWPEDVKLPPWLLKLTATERQLPGQTFGGCFEYPAGTMVVVKRVLGEDGSGRPGNYISVVMLDPSRRLGAVDLVSLAYGDFLDLSERISREPNSSAAALAFPIAGAWPREHLPGTGALPHSRYRSLEDARTAINDASKRFPPSLVNDLSVWAGEGDPPHLRGDGWPPEKVAIVHRAAELGWHSTDIWWRRAAGADWAACASDFVAVAEQDPAVSIPVITRVLESYPGHPVEHLALDLLEMRFGELDPSSPRLGEVAMRVLEHAMAASEDRALRFLSVAGQLVDDALLTDLVRKAQSRDVRLEPLAQHASAAADRVLETAGLRLQVEPDFAPTPVQAGPESTPERHRALHELRAAAASRDQAAVTNALRRAADSGASPEQVWSCVSGSEAQDGAFISVSSQFAAYWVLAINNSYRGSREFRRRLHHNLPNLTRAVGMPAPMRADYLWTVERARALIGLTWVAGALLLVTLSVAVLALLG